MDPLDFDLPQPSSPPPRRELPQPKIDAKAYEEERQRQEESWRVTFQRRRTDEVAPSPLGRTLPNSREAEEYVLSAALLDAETVVPMCQHAHVTSESFYVRANQVIYMQIVALHAAKKPAELSTVAEELKKQRRLDEVGGFAYLAQVSGRLPTTAQAGYFVDQLRRLELLRNTIREASTVVEECYGVSGDIDSLLTRLPDRFRPLAAGSNGTNDAVPLTNFAYPENRDPNILLGEDDYLGRGGGLLIVSYAGVGKSSLIMQCCQEWALGEHAFGLKPNGRLKSLIVQGEDSERYLGKVAGSFAAIRGLSVEQRAILAENVLVKEARGVNGVEFLNLVRKMVERHKPDLVVINPVYQYISGDLKEAADVRPFLTELDKINEDKKFGYILIHHTGKPTPKDNKGQRPDIENWETAYMGLGSSIWADWPRASAMLDINAQNQDGRHFWLKLGKGGPNAGLTRETNDENGSKICVPTLRVALKYSDKKILVGQEYRPAIMWEYDEDAMKSYDNKVKAARKNGAKGGRPAEHNFAFFRPVLQILAPTAEKAIGFNTLYRAANDALAIARPTFSDLVQGAIQSGEISTRADGKYYLPDLPRFSKETPADDNEPPPEFLDLQGK